MSHDAVVDAYRRRWEKEPRLVVRAPGRVNLIGEHTDYNDGFVLPLAIDRAVWIAFRPREDQRVIVHAVEFGDSIEADLGHLEKGGPPWAEYVKGVAWSLLDAGLPLTGWEGTILGDIPIGAGLSSSAALEVATARAFAAVSRWGWEPLAVARATQRAENEWVGVPCGIMDQLVSICGVAGHALLIDCRTLAIDPVPLPPGTAVVVLDTGTRRGVGDSAYEERRRQCQQAARLLGVPALRDLTSASLAGAAADLPQVLHQRARHIVSENERTQQAARALRSGRAEEAGLLMNASHASMRDDFEISTPELDAIVEAAWDRAECLGARLTGAGFGGCAVALVRESVLPGFVSAVEDAYHASTDRQASIYVCQAAAGAEEVPVVSDQ